MKYLNVVSSVILFQKIVIEFLAAFLNRGFSEPVVDCLTFIRIVIVRILFFYFSSIGAS